MEFRDCWVSWAKVPNYVMDSTSQASEAEKGFIHSGINLKQPQLKGRRRKRKNPSKLRSDMEGTITKGKRVSKSQCDGEVELG